ncbi:MAG TPA: ATP-binding protein [Pirellulales bacterium]
MFESIQFRNFKVLRDAVLPLQRFTLIIGPNSSGKSTALEGIHRLRQIENVDITTIRSIGANRTDAVEIKVKSVESPGGEAYVLRWQPDRGATSTFEPGGTSQGRQAAIANAVRSFRVFNFDPSAICQPAGLQGELEMRPGGQGLAALLDRLRDVDAERFEALSSEVSRWFPEFDRITFDVFGNQKGFALRIRRQQESVPAAALSEGTRIGIALLALAYLPRPPALVGIEEPEKGLHPRLLREVFDSLHRLSHPENYGENRNPVQVVATSHSPYFLDLFKDVPEEVVVAQRNGDGSATFSPLVRVPHLVEILGSATLGEAWFTGVLGGVPVAP